MQSSQEFIKCIFLFPLHFPNSIKKITIFGKVWNFSLYWGGLSFSRLDATSSMLVKWLPAIKLMNKQVETSTTVYFKQPHTFHIFLLIFVCIATTFRKSKRKICSKNSMIDGWLLLMTVVFEAEYGIPTFNWWWHKPVCSQPKWKFLELPPSIHKYIYC